MASKATEKYTAIYLNSAKKHNAQPIYEKQSIAPDRGNLVQVSGSDIDKYSKTTQKYIKDYSNQSVASFNPAEAARLRQEAVQRMMNNFVRDTNAGKKAYNEVTALLQNNQARKAAENSLQQEILDRQKDMYQRRKRREAIENQDARSAEIANEYANLSNTGLRTGIQGLGLTQRKENEKTRATQAAINQILYGTHQGDVKPSNADNLENYRSEQPKWQRGIFEYKNDPEAETYIRESFKQGNQISPYAYAFGYSSDVIDNDDSSVPQWIRDSDWYKNASAMDALGTVLPSGSDINNLLAYGLQPGMSDADRASLRLMSEDQQKEYSYILGKYGEERAQAYLDTVKPEANYLESRHILNDWNERNGVGKYVTALEYAADNGLRRLGAGVGDQFTNAVYGRDDLTQPSAEDLAYQQMRENYGRGTAAGLGLDIVQNATMMAPTQLVSLGAAFLTGGATAIPELIGLATTIAPMTYGNAYEEAKASGASTSQAQHYAFLEALNEAGGEYLLGGLEGVSGGFTRGLAEDMLGNLAAKVPGGVVEAVARATGHLLSSPEGRYAFSMMSEGFEEIVQGTVENYLKNSVLGANEDLNPLSEENLYSALVAALSVGLNNAPSYLSNKRAGKNVNINAHTLRAAADSISTSEIDYTSNGALDPDAYQAAQERKAQLENVAEYLEHGGRVSNAEKAELASTVMNSAANSLRHVETAAFLDPKRREARNVELRENIRGGFDENGKKAFDALEDDNIVEKARPFAAYYNLGRFGMKVSENMENAGRAFLSTEEISQAMRAGAADANILFPTKAAVQLQKITKGIKAKGREGTVTFDGIDQKNLTTQQKMRVDYATAFLTKALGLDVVFTQSKVVNGKYVGANGAYETVNGRPTITLDINAGMNSTTDWTGQMSDIRTMLPTISHELTHFLEQSNPEMYQKIANTVVAALQSSGRYSRGLNFNEILNQERMRLDEQLKDTGRVHTNQDAVHEIVARACEDMLSGNKEALQAFESFDANTKKTIADHIKEVFDNIRAFFEEMLRGYKSTSSEAKAIRQNMEEFEKIRAMWNEALGVATGTSGVDAAAINESAAVASAFGNDTGDVIRDNNGNAVIAESEDGSAMVYSLRTLSTTQEKLAEVLKNKGYSEESIKAAQNQVEEVADMLTRVSTYYAEMADALNAELLVDPKTGKTVLHSFVTNGDYPVNIDFLTICKKREAYMHVLTDLISDGVFDQVAFNGAAIAATNEILRDAGFETACACCFVESRRLQIQRWAETFCSEWNEEVLKRNPNATPFGFSEGERGVNSLTQDEILQLENELRSVTKKEKNPKGNIKLPNKGAKANMGPLLDRIPSLAHTLSVGDLITPNGIDSLRALDSNLFSLVKQRYGTATPKITQSFSPYNGDVADLSYGFMRTEINETVPGSKQYKADAKKELISEGIKKPTAQQVEERALRKYLYDIGGVRLQSFSDYLIENTLDYFQMFADLAAKELPLHAYSKEISFIKVFGMTGGKMNMSLIPVVDLNTDKDHAGLKKNADGSYSYAGWGDYEHHIMIDNRSFIQSIGWKDAIALQLHPGYSKNIGTIAIGISDAHIRKMLNDPLIRMVIPYHSSGMLPEFAKQMHIDYYHDYTTTQNTTLGKCTDMNGNVVETYKLKGDGSYKCDTHYDFNEAFQRLGDARAACEEYKAWCKKKHPVYKGKTQVGWAEFIPKFNDFADETNYYKLIEDFNSYDCITEEPAIQGAVTMSFPGAEANLLDEAELKAYEERLRATGQFTEKEIQKYVSRANESLEEIITREAKNRNAYHRAMDEKYDATLKKVEDKLQKDFNKADYELVDNQYRRIGGKQLSTREIVGPSGKNYGIGIYLESEVFNNVDDDKRADKLAEYVINNMAGKTFIAYDQNGDSVQIDIARPEESFRSSHGHRRNVLQELYGRNSGMKVKQESVVLAPELLANGKEQKPSRNKHAHGWLDNYGKNDWRRWKTYVQETDGTVHEAYLLVTTAEDGRKILYDIYPIIKVDGPVKSDTQSTTDTIPTIKENSNTGSESDGNNPAYTGAYPSGKQFQHRVTEDEMLPDGSEKVLDFLNRQIENGEYTTVYKALLKIGDKFYPPMASLEKDDNGKYTKLRGGQQKGDWIASDGILTDDMKAKMTMKSPKPWQKQYADALANGRNPWGVYGNFTLKKSDASGKAVGDVGAAYNPYQHSSDQVLNDQFEAAYSRPDLVVVECRIPNSELNDPYWAPYAKDPTGMHEWKTGPIAGQLKNTTRHVYMTRWIQPVRVLEPAEVASKIYDVISKEDTQPRMYWNTLHPGVMTELEKLGVEIDPYGSPMHISKDNARDRYGNVIPSDVKEKIQRDRKAGKKSKEQSQRGVDLDQRLDALVQKYGALPKGEKAVKDIDVPEQTSDGKRVRRYARTVLESGITSDLMDEEIKEKILKEGLSYEPITDASSAEYAASVLRIGGTVKAQKEWDRARRSDTFNKDAMAVGQELLREYAKQGDVENVVKMVTELAAEGTRMGQNIQAMRMLKKYATQSPAIGLGYIQRTVDIMNREAKAKMGKKYKEMVIDPKLADQYINATTKDQIDAALGKIYKNLGSQVQKTTGEEIVDRLRTWRYMSMLGNPRTHVRNLVGNALFVPAVNIKNAIGAGIESRMKVKERTKALVTTKESRQFAAQDAKEMQDILQGNADKSVRQLIMDERKTFTIPALNKFSKLNGDALEAEDWVFLRYHYQNALAQYITANKLDPNNLDGKDLAKARQYAVKEAQKATYRDANKLSSWLNQSSGAGAVVKYMMEGMLPFKKTPTNILRRGIEYSPAMLVERLSKGIIDLNRGKISVNEWIDGFASGLTGTGIFLVGMFLASTGAILGGYADDDDKKKRKLRGEQEYAVKIGNYTYTIDWAAPGSLPLFVGVETTYALREDGNFTMDDLSKSAARLIDPMINMSMLSGLNDTLDAISYADDKLSTLAMETFFNLLGQYVPTLFGQVARTMDTTQRINYQDVNKGMPKNMLYFLEKMQNKIPYMTFSNDPYLNEFGQENVTENRFIAALQNFVSPGYISTIKDDKVLNELERVQGEQEENVYPKKMDKYLGKGDDRIDLTSAQYTQFQRTAGQLSYNILDNMIDDSRYNNLNADQQAEAIKMAYDYAKAVGRLELQPEYELKGDAKKVYEAVEEGSQAYDAILTLSQTKAVTGDIVGDKDEKGKTITGTEKLNKIKAILDSKGSVSEKAAMFESLYPDDNLYKEWKKSRYSAVDYMKYYSDIKAFSGDKKQERVVSYIKRQTSDVNKQKLLFQVAGYELDSTKDGKTIPDGNFKKKMGY